RARARLVQPAHDARDAHRPGPRRRRRALGQAVTVLDPESPAAPLLASPAASPPPGAALEGDLARFGVADVLQFLRLAGATGRLECRRGDDRVQVAFAHGRPVWASNSGLAVRVGDVLVHRGWAATAALEAAIAAQVVEPARRVGALLRERGVAEAHVA